MLSNLNLTNLLKLILIGTQVKEILTKIRGYLLKWSGAPTLKTPIMRNISKEAKLTMMVRERMPH